MKKYLILIFSFCIQACATSSHALEQNSCWQGEVNPLTKQIYLSKQLWEMDYNLWLAQQPSKPDIFRLGRAYLVYKEAKKNEALFKTDKSLHCYMGCVISNKVDFKTASYVAWLKEKNDLSDCKPDTHFEQADFKATLVGAMKRPATAVQCIQQCQQQF